MNERQKISAEEWKDQRETERNDKEAQTYFENNKAIFKKMGYQASIEHLGKQNLKSEVLVFVRRKVYNLLQPDVYTLHKSV